MKKYAELMDLANKSLENTVKDSLRGSDALTESCMHLINAGGKRIRAMIPMFVTGSFGIDPRKAINVGVVHELIHTFTLCHDDIIDHSPKRRGVDSVHVKYDTGTAIITGDTLFSIAMNTVSRIDIFEDYKIRMYRTIIQACIDMAVGQNFDMTLDKDMTELEYLSMISGKTSALFKSATKCGAIYACSRRLYDEFDETYIIELYERFGRLYGMSFQMRDDIIDNENTNQNLIEKIDDYSLKMQDIILQIKYFFSGTNEYLDMVEMMIEKQKTRLI